MIISKQIKTLLIFFNVTLITLILLVVLFCCLVPLDFYVEVYGTIESQHQVILKTKQKGIIENVYVEEGLSVSQGKTILELNDPEIAFDKMKIELEYQESKQDFENKKELFEKGIVSNKEYQESQRKFELAKVKLNSIESYSIKAPVSGILISNEELTLRKGDYVQAGTIISKIIDLDNLVLRIYIPEYDMSKIHVNQKAMIIVNALPYLKHSLLEGHLTKILPEAKPEKDVMVFLGLVKIDNTEIKISNKDFRLLPMMTAKVRLMYRRSTVLKFLIEQKVGYETM